MIEGDAGRNFRGLDAREAQEALKEELAEENTETMLNKENGTAALTEEAEQTQAEAQDAAEAAGPADDWSEEDLAEHVRMVEALLFAAACVAAQPGRRHPGRTHDRPRAPPCRGPHAGQPRG